MTAQPDIVDQMLRDMVAKQIEREGQFSSFMIRAGLLRDILDENTRANPAAEALAKALEGVRDDLHNENGLNLYSITDVVWHSDIETTVDYIEAALAAYRAGRQP